MIKIIKFFSVFMMLLIAQSVCASGTQSQVASQGETIIMLSSDVQKVQVKISTQEVDIGKSGAKKVLIPRLSCTYSKYPCSIVVDIYIAVNDKKLFVPRSVFFDLADLKLAEIKSKNNIMAVILSGGDASESYIATIEFDENGISRRIISSAMMPNNPLEETKYYINEI